MDTNMTFRIDSQVKAQMAAICEQPHPPHSTFLQMPLSAIMECRFP